MERSIANEVLSGRTVQSMAPSRSEVWFEMMMFPPFPRSSSGRPAIRSPQKVLKRRSAAFLVSPLWMKKADDAAMRKVTRDTVMKAAARLPETIESEQRSDPATMKREFQILPEAITLARSLSLGSDCRQVLSGTMNMLPPRPQGRDLLPSSRT